MPLSRQNQDTLLIALHELIEEAAEHTVRSLANPSSLDLAYPPNGGLTSSEQEAVRELTVTPHLQHALRKVVADACCTVVFSFLNYVDGTADPGRGKWSGIALVDRKDSDHAEGMLHDEFFEKYWEWRKIRPRKVWRLDNLP